MGPSLDLIEQLFCCLNRIFYKLVCLRAKRTFSYMVKFPLLGKKVKILLQETGDRCLTPSFPEYQMLQIRLSLCLSPLDNFSNSKYLLW